MLMQHRLQWLALKAGPKKSLKAPLPSLQQRQLAQAPMASTKSLTIVDAVGVADRVNIADEEEEGATGATEVAGKEDIVVVAAIEVIDEAMANIVDVDEVGPEGADVGVGMVSPGPPHDVACEFVRLWVPALPARTRCLQKIFVE